MSMHSALPLGKLRIAAIICCLVLIFGIISCSLYNDKNSSVLNKDDIVNNIDKVKEDDADYSYMSSYLKKYGIGNINTYKVNEAETKIRKYYYKELPTPLELSEKVASLFLENFYDKIDLNDKETVTNAVLACLVHAIEDPYAFYRTKEEYENYSNSLDGGEEFVGIGIQISMETLEISMVFKDSGADEAGIKPKDILWGVNDKTVEDTPPEDLLNMIKGEANTTVKITVKRGDELLEFTVMRKVLTERTVYYEIDDDNIGYIQITQFLGSTVEEFKEAVDYCTRNGAKALIFDLRYNPGGLLYSVVDVIDYITPDAPSRRIASYSQAGVEEIFYTEDGHGVNLPIVVICNEYTASAGELFTGAMRDYGKSGILNTTVVGSTTYGKGIAQSTFLLYDGSGITLTISYYNPPSDVNFDGIGVIPDIKVEESSEYDAPYEAAKQEALDMIGSTGTPTAYLGFAA